MDERCELCVHSISYSLKFGYLQSHPAITLTHVVSVGYHRALPSLLAPLTATTLYNPPYPVDIDHANQCCGGRQSPTSICMFYSVVLFHADELAHTKGGLIAQHASCVDSACSSRTFTGPWEGLTRQSRTFVSRWYWLLSISSPRLLVFLQHCSSDFSLRLHNIDPSLHRLVIPCV